MKPLFLLIILVLLPAVSIASKDIPSNKSGSPAEADGGGLFFDATVSGDTVKINSPTTVRARYVNVKFDLLGDKDSLADTVNLNLFGDASFTAVFERTETNALGSYAWIGHLEGVDDGQAVLVVTNGILAGKVSMPGAIYEVRFVGDKLHVVEEIDQSAFPPELHGIPAPAAKTAPDITTPLAVDACNEITVLVPYTPEARAAAGGTAQIEAVIALAVTETNQSYVSSGLTQRINLVHTLETAPGDAANSFYTDLYALQNTSDGIFDDVDAARETYFADEVALIIEDFTYCGLAYLNSSADYAFSVTHRTCATGYYSFGHELGHNMSARHDWYVDDSLYSPWSYNKGFVNVSDGWRTIMAYNTRCSDAGSYCTRLQYWSNPNVTYGGDPMGVSTSGPINCDAGSTAPDPSTCAADNRTTLNNTCTTVANFRVSTVTGDQYEPDNTSGQATTIQNGVSQTHSIIPANDVDWVKFSLTGTTDIVLETSGPSGDTRLWLYDSSLTEIAFDDDGGSSFFSRISETSLPSGTYYAKVDEYGNNNEISSYSILLTVAYKSYNLSASKTGNGTIISSPPGINCGSDCSEVYVQDTSVTLTATPDSGWGFSLWGGACSGTGTCMVTMTSAKNVSATFTYVSQNAGLQPILYYILRSHKSTSSSTQASAASSSTQASAASIIPRKTCADGMVYDCEEKCVDEVIALDWVGDGVCNDETHEMNLLCPAFQNDSGDCK